MSELRDTPAADLKARHGLKVFVETGYSEGAGFAYAHSLGFSPCFSCDLKVPFDVVWYADGSSVFAINSTDFLEPFEIEAPTLFWLDAHSPAHHPPQEGEEFCFPLADELRILSRKLGIHQCAIICDDVEAFRDSGCFNAEVHTTWPVEDSLQELIGLFAGTHIASVKPMQEGCLLILEPMCGLPL